MAIHAEHPGLSAEVVVDGEALREYDDVDHASTRDANVIAKYVEVNNESLFGIRYTIPPGFSEEFGIKAHLTIDGKRIRSYTHNKHEVRGAERDIVNCLDAHYSVVDGMKYSQKFRFSQLQIDEQDADVDETISELLKYVGILTLKLAFTKDISNSSHLRRGYSRNTTNVKSEQLPVIGKVAEKNLKGDARSHQASLDAPVARGSTYRPSSRTTEACIAMGKTIAVFHFRYRSSAALKSLHIMPRTPSPSPHREAHGAMSYMSRALAQPEPASQQNNEVKTEEVKKEKGASLKREANDIGEQDEVQFVSSKRMKKAPTHRDEVIVLD